ncbi:MAG: Bacterial transcriptional regulator, partial [Actinomycetota bacterium]
QRIATMVDVVESPQALRMAVPVGTTFQMNQAAGSPYDVQPYLQRFPDGSSAWGAPLVDQSPRYWVHDRSYPSAMSIGSIIYDGPGGPIGTLAVIGPKTRIQPDQHRTMGELVADAARVISGF